MKLSELPRTSNSILKAVPYGKIENKKQYDYMIDFSKKLGIEFYWSREDRHTPTFEECKDQYLSLTSFNLSLGNFDKMTFYFIFLDHYSEWDNKNKCIKDVFPKFNYGEYGKLDLDK